MMPRIFRIVIAGLILFSIFIVFLTIPREDKFAKGADEGYYFMYAKTVKEAGIAQFPLMLKRHLSDKVAQLFPNPARVGHTLMTALWFKLFPNTFVWLARFSFFCFLLFLIISFYFCKNFFGNDIAYLYTLLLSCDPLIMASGRRALQDSNVNLFWTLSIWLFLDFLTNTKRDKFILFLIVYSTSIMVKESSIVLLIFFIFSFFLYKYRYRHELSNKYLLGIITIPVMVIGSLYIFLFGGISNILSLTSFISGVHFPKAVTNSYSLYGMGPWYKYIIDYLLLTPITTFLFIGFFFYVLISRKLKREILYFFWYFTIIFAIFSSLTYTKIIRFVSPLNITINLFAVLSIYELFKYVKENYRIYTVFIAVIVIFFMNYNNFLYLFCRLDIYDPVSYWLLIAKKIIPYQ